MTAVPVSNSRFSILRRGRRARLALEFLEDRLTPAGSWPGFAAPQQELEPNDTVNRSQALGALPAGGKLEFVGHVGDSAAGSADVDWYRFTLDRATETSLQAVRDTSRPAFTPQLSLFNNDANYFNDPSNGNGYRLVASSGNGALSRRLAAGTYFLAVSGAGNTLFHPFLANSGQSGTTGDYGVRITSKALPAVKGPTVLGADPLGDAVLTAAPLVVHVNLSANLDPAAINANDTVRLVWSPDNRFGDANDRDVNLTSVSFTDSTHELVIVPERALTTGFCRVMLAGRQASGRNVLTGIDGTPLGATATTPAGSDFTFTFRVTGQEGGTRPDDTAATAHELGNVLGTVVRTNGAIGDDPGYDPNSVDSKFAAVGSDVDLYHFRLSGSGRFALVGEVYAGRIGSPLDAGLSLFRRDATGRLVLVTADDNSNNDSLAGNGTLPLYTDATLFAGLVAGDYYLAVSSADNTPDAGLGRAVGLDGVFDPNASHSGSAGSSTGRYVLAVTAVADNTAPRVANVSLTEGSTLSAAPTRFTVQFNEPVMLQALAAAGFDQTLGGVSVVGADGVIYRPRMESYDAATRTATFLMLDALPNGTTALRLSGPGGLTDFAGNALVGNDASGDFVVRFTVSGAPRGSAGDARHWLSGSGNDDAAHAQTLGALFPHELQSGVTIERTNTDGAGSGDYYGIDLLQRQVYFFNLSGAAQQAGARLTLFDAAGQAINVDISPNGELIRADLAPGHYELGVSGWQNGAATYRVLATLGAAFENPTPLTVGPAPAVRLQLVGNDPTTGNSPSPSSGGGARFTLSAPPANSSLPSDGLLALRSGPAGGVGQSTANTGFTSRERANGLELVMVPLENLAGLLVLAQPSDDGSAEFDEFDFDVPEPKTPKAPTPKKSTRPGATSALPATQPQNAEFASTTLGELLTVLLTGTISEEVAPEASENAMVAVIEPATVPVSNTTVTRSMPQTWLTAALAGVVVGGTISARYSRDRHRSVELAKRHG